MDNVSEKEPLLASDQNETPPEKGKDKPRRVQRIITVEPVIILIGFCLTASIPLLEQYGYGKLAAEANVTIISIGESQCDFNESDPLYEAQQEIQAETSDFFVIISLLTSLPNIVVVPIFMFVSDRFGRKPILLFNLFVMLIGYAEWVTFVQTNQPLNMLFIGAATFGLLGSQTLLSICLAYYADSTDHTNRSFKMVIFEVCVSIASILSNLTTGFLIKYVDIIYPFLSFIVCASIAILYTLFLLPESLSNSARSKHERNCRNCLAPYKAAFTIFFKDNGTNRRWKIQIAAVVSAVVTANHIGLLVILPLYLLNSPLCFDSVAIGVVIVEIYVLRAVGSLAIPKLFKRLMDDTSFILLSLLSDICLFSIIGFLPYTTWVFFGRYIFPGDMHNNHKRCRNV